MKILEHGTPRRVSGLDLDMGMLVKDLDLNTFCIVDDEGKLIDLTTGERYDANRKDMFHIYPHAELNPGVPE